MALMANSLTYSQALELLKKGEVAPVYVLVGEEKYLQDDLVERITRLVLDSATRDFNYDMFYGGDISADKIIAIARSFPMMAQRRVVVIKEMQQLKITDLKYLSDYVSHPSKSTCVIFTLPEKKPSGKWQNAICDQAVTVDCRKLYDNEVPGWIENYVRTKKLTIDPNAAQLLQAQVGNSLLDLVNELVKIEISISPRTTITIADVQSVTCISKQFNIFDLCNAIGQKNLPQSLGILANLLDQGESPTGMIIQLMRHFVNLMKIRENMQRGIRSASELSKIVGLNYYFINDLMKQASNFSIEQFRNSFTHLAEADLHLKTSYQRPELVMELLIYRLIKR